MKVYACQCLYRGLAVFHAASRFCRTRAAWCCCPSDGAWRSLGSLVVSLVVLPVATVGSIVALGGVIYAFAEVHDYDELTYRGGFLLLALCAAVLLATVAHPQSALGRVLARRVPRWLGERSYGIYLWHWPVLEMSRPGIDMHIARLREKTGLPVQHVVSIDGGS